MTTSGSGDTKTFITLETLLKDQYIDLESLNRCMSYIEDLQQDARLGPVLENRAKHLFMCWTSFVSRHYQLHHIATNDEIKNRSYFKNKIFETTEAKYLSISDLLSLWMTTANPPSKPSIFQGQPSEQSNVKLPPISIPMFSGKLTEWATFKDSFQSLIVSQKNLSKLEKLHYLKASVQGDAHELICNITLVASNFETAWDLLTTRYSNTRASVNAHINEIFSIEPIKKESASSLLNLRNIIKRNLSALNNLDRPIENYSDILINRLVDRLDPNTQRDWELSLAATTNCPSYDDFDKFLLNRIRALEALGRVETVVKSNPNKQINSQTKTNTSKNKSILANSYVISHENSQCLVCNEEHKIYKCPTFSSLSPIDRFAKIKSLQLCTNCLTKGHKLQNCSSKHTCFECKMKHHTLLHRQNANKVKLNQVDEKSSALISNQAESSNVQSHFLTTESLREKRVILATIKLCVFSNSNQKIVVRALVDQGSTWSFVSKKLATALNAKQTRVTATLSGLSGNSAGTSSSAIEINLCPINSEKPKLSTQALVIPRITTYIPEKRIAFEKWPHLNNIEFSDDFKSDEEIHMLIGADLYGGLILNEIKKGGLNEPVAQNTIFGWILSGPVSSGIFSNLNPISIHLCTEFNQLNSTLNKFWEIENIPTEKPISPEDEFCESHFMSTHSRTEKGQYMVRIPFSSESPQIGQSRHIAERSLKSIESKLEKNSEHKEMYNKFMKEYETLQHMTRIINLNSIPKPIVFIPHHPIFRFYSQTTKMRAVFHASKKTSNGKSLNDHMLTGPKLQPDLCHILCQWRSYRFVYTADITKMYRQILIDPSDRHYQCILWRVSPTFPISEYQLNTVTYGTRSAPYLALRVMKQLVSDEGSNYPLASPVLLHDTFVDDFLFGSHDRKTAKLTRDEVISLLKKGQLEARKWASNDSSLISDINPENHGLAWNTSGSGSDEQMLKVLGITWKTDTDTFHYAVNLEIPEILTHRVVLSLLAQLFDPVGWISPIIVKGKILMQKTWLCKVNWDEPLPNSLQNEWYNYFLSLKKLSKISIPRWNYYDPKNSQIELHGFSDASDLAYGAVIYQRTISNKGEIKVSLIASKTKVCPIKKISIPRAELQGAVLLARLFSSLKGVRAFSNISIYCWTDSMVVLAWLSKHASSWKLFVANRVSEIQTLLPSQKWKHVPTDSNPADLASRGQSPLQLHESTIWWNGPNWLMLHPDQWPSQNLPSDEESSVELKSNTHHINDLSTHPLYNHLIKFSSWEKIIRIIAYVLKFVKLCIKTMSKKSFSFKTFREQVQFDQSDNKVESTKNLTAKDLLDAKIILYKMLQQQFLSEDIKSLIERKYVSSKSPLHSLNPFIDKQGVVRVGGRLENSNLPFETKHPVILKKHPIVTSLIRSTHVNCLHGGMKLTLSTLRQQVWIINPRPQIKSVLFKCILCTRLRASMATQLMSNLPKSRVTKPPKPFTHCGLDYAGPLQVRLASGRGHKSQSCYIALFICLSVKAIHLELVSDYSSEKFIAAYQRFCSRRGIPAHIYSDHGTNFKGASRLLQEDFARITAEPDFHALLAKDNVIWHFIPPAAPHFGGIWEAGIKSVKTHLKRILLGKTPTLEELQTLLCQIESILNSRPIAPYTDNVDDLDPLTPGHFLIGGPINAVPFESLINLNENRLTRWQQMQQMFEKFWKRWSTDYLQSLQHRTKWQISNVQIKTGQMVLLRKPDLPPTKWNLARISECFPGTDGVIRVVKVKTYKSEYIRPITELILLPIDLNEN